MNFIKRNLTSILILVLLVVAIYTYSVFFGPLFPEVQNNDLSVRTEVSQKLSRFESFRDIGSDIFDSPAFKNLESNSAPVPTETTGRTNPFGSLGR